MGLGMGSGRMSSSSELPVALIAVVLVAGLIVGYAAGNFAPLSPAQAQQGTGSGFTKLSNDDKNFFVQVANAQVSLMAQQAATVDWCTAGGGLWLTQQREGQVPVTAEQAGQLQGQGGQVVQSADGKLLATVVLFDRGSCVVVPTQGKAGQ